MRILSFLFLMLSIASYYLSVHARNEELALRLIEFEGNMPAPIWQITLTLGIVSIVLGRFLQPRTTHTVSPQRIQPRKRTSLQQERKEPPPQKQSVAESTEAEGWREELAEKIKQYAFPRGGNIKFDTQKDVPFTLLIGRLTHQAKKDTIGRFATLISEIPTPKRIIIRFEEPCDKNVQNMVRAAFRKHNHISDIIIRTESYQTEVQFHHPDQKWHEHYNILRRF